MSAPFLTHAEALDRLKLAVAGNQYVFAKKHGINQGKLSHILSGQSAMTPLVAQTIGLKKMMVFFTDAEES